MCRVYNHIGKTVPGFILKLRILNFPHPCYYCDLCCYNGGDWKRLVQTCRASGILDGFPKMEVSLVTQHLLHPSCYQEGTLNISCTSARQEKKCIASFTLC